MRGDRHLSLLAVTLLESPANPVRKTPEFRWYFFGIDVPGIRRRLPTAFVCVYNAHVLSLFLAAVTAGRITDLVGPFRSGFFTRVAGFPRKRLAGLLLKFGGQPYCAPAFVYRLLQCQSDRLPCDRTPTKIPDCLDILGAHIPIFSSSCRAASDCRRRCAGVIATAEDSSFCA